MMNRKSLKNFESKKKEETKIVKVERIPVEDKENAHDSSAMKKEFLKRLYSRDRSKSKEKDTYPSSKIESVN